jgi:SAM-dependent methyltransferase
MDNQLTSKEFWLRYWESKSDVVKQVPRHVLFSDMLDKVVAMGKVRTSLELGGFPGHYSIYLRKYHGVVATLLDYVIHPRLLGELQTANNLQPGEVTAMEEDLFTHTPEQQYDLVFSNGLIEHFKDTEDIIRQHIKYLKKDGVLWLSLPNLRGMNGLVQQWFDKENYDIHYLDCMDPEYLAGICAKLGLRDIEAGYYGKFSVWLEKKPGTSVVAKAVTRSIWLAGKVFFKVVPIESRFFSPYIILTARR